MGLTKTEKFTAEQNTLASFAKVLGHPARIAILEQIILSKTCICNHLVVEIGLAQATISQHLAELKKVGIIKGTISGTSVCYCIDNKSWKKVKKMFKLFFNKELKDLKNCC